MGTGSLTTFSRPPRSSDRHRERPSLTEDTLAYDFYTADGNEVKLFDTLRVMKTN